MNDRFYYLGDWVDEYCDLTLEKLITEAGAEILRNIQIPEDKATLIDECNNLIENNGRLTVPTQTNVTVPTTFTSGTNNTTFVNIITPSQE